MKIPLDNFEMEISPALLAKGLQYFSNDQVTSFDRIDQTTFSFVVEGTSEYIVNLKFDIHRNLVRSECNCLSFSNNLMCKHVVACLFFMNEGEFNDEIRPKKKNDRIVKAQISKTKSKSSNGTIAEKVLRILEPLAEEELKRIICEVAQKDRVFRASLFARYLSSSSDVSLDRYKQEVQAIIRINRGSNRRNDWNLSSIIIGPLRELFVSAQSNLEDGNTESGFNLSCALLSEIMPVFEYSHDSSGALSGFWNEVFTWTIGVVRDGEKKLTNLYIDFVVKHCHKGFAFDFGIHLVRSSFEFLRTDSDFHKMDKLFLKIRKGKEGNYVKQTIFELEYELLILRGENDQALEFIYKNKSVPRLRSILLLELESREDWKEYLNLALEGEQENESPLSYGHSWEKEIERAMFKLGMSEELFDRELRRYCISGFRIEDWRRLKNNSVQDSKFRIEKMLNALERSNTNVFERLAIWKHEGEFDRIVKLIEANPIPQFIDAFSDLIKKRKPKLFLERHLQYLNSLNVGKYNSHGPYYHDAVKSLKAIEDIISPEVLLEYYRTSERVNGKKRVYNQILRPEVFRVLGAKGVHPEVLI